MRFLEEPFKTAWENKDPFSQIQLIKGQIYRKIDTRQTLNFLFNGQSFYIKIHEGTTVKEFLKNIFCLRLPNWGGHVLNIKQFSVYTKLTCLQWMWPLLVKRE